MILDNFPKILWINLDRSTKRKMYMETLLNAYKLNHTRIKAVNGLNRLGSDLDSVCIINTKLTRPENACTCSHLKAIKYFVENMSDDKVIIFEDDVSFDFLQNIPFNWSKLEENFPQKFDVIQLAITFENGAVSNTLIKTNPLMKYYCSAAYLITRSGAINLLNKYYSNDLKKINLATQEHATADSMISSTGNTYSVPIFTYRVADSIIHPLHLYNHNKSKKQQDTQWKSIMNNINLFDIDDYFQKFEKN